MKFILNSIVLFFGLVFTQAQTTFTIKGKVIDYHDKVPLKQAKITIGTATQISDAKGNFIFKALDKLSSLYVIHQGKIKITR